MSLKLEVKELKETLEKHLIESGEIRADLRWLKKAYWTLAGAGITFNIVIVGYVINHLISK